MNERPAVPGLVLPRQGPIASLLSCEERLTLDGRSELMVAHHSRISCSGGDSLGNSPLPGRPPLHPQRCSFPIPRQRNALERKKRVKGHAWACGTNTSREFAPPVSHHVDVAFCWNRDNAN